MSHAKSQSGTGSKAVPSSAFYGNRRSMPEFDDGAPTSISKVADDQRGAITTIIALLVKYRIKPQMMNALRF